VNAVTKGSTDIEGLLGAETGSLLNQVCKGIPKASPHLPGPDFVDRVVADIIKQKLPENNGGYNAVNSKDNPYGKTDKRVYTELTTDHPIDLTRYQVANCYMGRSGLINFGGASGENDFHDAVRTAVINKRAGGTGLISGRKAFQRPIAEGVKLLNAIQDVYLDSRITIA
jgi:class I fructose-bisphosphate aldolase